jgi:hypothetical protein
MGLRVIVISQEKKGQDFEDSGKAIPAIGQQTLIQGPTEFSIL